LKAQLDSRHRPCNFVELMPRLMERFYRVDSARTREVGGTGLGLAIVKGIVNRHRAAITVDSVVGEGSTFHVYLPIYDD
jgi:two-component system phosphate regulon sensor histidine kinase PhoR